MDLKIENWNGQDIRFVFVENEWWAVAKDVSKALELKDATEVANMIDEEEKMILTNPMLSGSSKLSDILGADFYRQGKAILINEFGIYEASFSSKSKEAKEFKKWVKQVIKKLREQSGLDGFEVFKMFDKEVQKEAMRKLSTIEQKEGEPPKYVKANTIANKAVSNRYGFKKLIKKDQMTPEMLADRQIILEDTVDLMQLKNKFNLDIPVSETIYQKYN